MIWLSITTVSFTQPCQNLYSAEAGSNGTFCYQAFTQSQTQDANFLDSHNKLATELYLIFLNTEKDAFKSSVNLSFYMARLIKLYLYL